MSSLFYTPLEKISAQAGVRTLMLEGGGGINAARGVERTGDVLWLRYRLESGEGKGYGA